MSQATAVVVKGWDVAEAAQRYREKKAAEIRRFMQTTPGIWDMHEPRPYLDTLILLSHLEPDGIKPAMWCHDQLAREAHRTLCQLGFLDAWMGDLLFILLGFIEAHGYKRVGNTALSKARFQQVGLDEWIPQ